MNENIKTVAEKGEKKVYMWERKKDSNANPTLGSVLQSGLLRESSFALHTALL